MENSQLEQPMLPNENEISPTSDILRFGLIGGLILVILSFATIIFDLQFSSLITAFLLGIAVYGIVILVLIIGVKTHRDQTLGGYISFGRAFVTGTLIGFLAGLINQAFNVIYNFIDPGYMERITETMLEMYEERGMTEEQLEMIAERMADPNSVSNILIGMGTFLIFSAIVAAIAAAIMKREKPNTLDA